MRTTLNTLTALAGFLLPTIAFAAAYGGGSVSDGIDAALGLLPGSQVGDLGSFITSLTETLRTFVVIVGIFAIVVAGFYLLLGFGDEGAKDRAKKIILYTLIGIIIVNLAADIVNLFYGVSLGNGTIDTALPCRIFGIMLQAITYVALIATIVIVIAGFYLLLGFGSEGAKETAQRMILYVIAGILIITFASAIVGFVYMLSGGTGTLVTCGSTGVGSGFAGTDIRTTVINVLNIALGFVGLIAVIALIIAGLMLILGFGSEAAWERAKKIILYTIIGLLVILFARVIVGFFLNLNTYL